MKRVLRITFGAFALLLVLHTPYQVYASSSLPQPEIEPPTQAEAVTASAAADAVPSSDTTSTSEPAPLDGDINITGYELYDGANAAKISTVNPDDAICLWVTIKDTRPESEGLVPTATVNSASFRTLKQDGSSGEADYHNAAGGSYKLLFVVRYTGQGSDFSFDISYPSAGTALPMRTLTVKLNQCNEREEEKDEEDKEPLEEPEVKGTGFVLKSADYGADSLFAGESFTLKTILLSTNGEHNLENVTLTMQLPPELSLTTGTSVEYIGTVRPNQEVEVEINLTPIAIAEEGTYTLDLVVMGVNALDGEEKKATITISLPVRQKERFEIFNVDFPGQVNYSFDDGMGLGSISMINKGKNTAYNVMVSVQGTGIKAEGGAVFVGNIEPGKQDYADINLLGTTKGTCDVIITVTYETAAGEEKTLTETVPVVVDTFTSANVQDVLPLEDDTPLADAQAFPAWAWLIILAIAIGLGFGGYRLSKVRKARKAAVGGVIQNDEDF